MEHKGDFRTRLQTTDDPVGAAAPAGRWTAYAFGMSISIYRGQVDRLRDEIAKLERRTADEKSRAAQERRESLRIAGSITASTSASTARSKLTDAQRREERAAAHDKKAAAYNDEIARKNRQLSDSQSALERASKQERKKMEAEGRRRREADLQHVRELEWRRRAIRSEAGTVVQLSEPRVSGGAVDFVSGAVAPKRRATALTYDVCLSFAGEERSYAEMVARGLKERGLDVFYDEDEKASLWGKNLVEHFDYIYRDASRYCIMFISAAYAAKPWTRLERRSALARALVEEGEYILPVRFDDTQLPGIPPTVGYLDLRDIAPATVVEFVLEKLGRTTKPADVTAERDRTTKA